MKGCLGGIIFMVLLSAVDILFKKTLPFQTYQTVTTILIIILFSTAIVMTWIKREELGGRMIALIWFFVAIPLCAMIILLTRY